jgi:hypothetical protein
VTAEGVLLLAGSVLLAFADRSSRYWSFVFPAFILGSAANAHLYTQVNISVFKTAPASHSGAVGSILNSALQLGAAVAATTAIQTNVNKGQPDPVTSFRGRAAMFWILLGLVAVEMIGYWIFFKVSSAPANGDPLPEPTEWQGLPQESGNKVRSHLKFITEDNRGLHIYESTKNNSLLDCIDSAVFQ